MIISTLVCLCIIFSQVNAQLNTLGHCKEEVCCNKQGTPLLTSCKDIKRKWSDSPSGYYQLGTKRGPVSVYCNMDELCGSKEGWTRLGYLNMADPSESCPYGFKLYQHGGVRACGRQSSSVGSCVALELLADDISYSQVCGRVVGYQYASTDAVDSTIGTGAHNDINSYYVDGVSITRGSPRQHVWTLIAGYLEASHRSVHGGVYNCPCSQGSTQNSTLQSFIGNDYFCESGNPATDGTYQSILYASDPLWDGKGCGSLEGTCCAAPGLPWFHKKLNTTTTDYLELRVCGDEGTGNEDTPISFYEIYVK